jgi:hypothetical protein
MNAVRNESDVQARAAGAIETLYGKDIILRMLSGDTQL